MTHSNYPPDHDPRLDSGDDEIEEVPEFDDSDDWRENQLEEEDGVLLHVKAPNFIQGQER